MALGNWEPFRTLSKNGRRKLFGKILLFSILEAIFLCMIWISYLFAEEAQHSTYFRNPFENSKNLIPLIVTVVTHTFICLLRLYMTVSLFRVKSQPNPVKLLLRLRILILFHYLFAVTNFALLFHIVPAYSEMKAERKVELQKRFTEYKTKVESRIWVDTLQMEYDCCGINSLKDWTDWQWFSASELTLEILASYRKNYEKSHDEKFSNNSVPWSCCDPTYLGPCTFIGIDIDDPKGLSQNNCYDRLWFEFAPFFLEIIVVEVAESVLQVYLAVLTSMLVTSVLTVGNWGSTSLGQGFFFPLTLSINELNIKRT